MSDKIIRKTFDRPDEVRPFAGHGHADVLGLNDHTVLRGTFEPGWRWSNDVRPIAGTDLCETAHFGYVLSGRMALVMADGTESEVGPGTVALIPPGHDAWVVGHEPCVFLDWGSVANYARR